LEFSHLGKGNFVSFTEGQRFFNMVLVFEN
jgi:hypothetical protein